MENFLISYTPFPPDDSTQYCHTKCEYVNSTNGVESEKIIPDMLHWNASVFHNYF